MEEDIEIVEEMKQNCLTKREYIDPKAERKAQAIENLIKGYRELDYALERQIRIKEEEFIPKSKIKEKIEEDAFEVYTRECGNIEVVCTDSLYELMEDK